MIKNSPLNQFVPDTFLYSDENICDLLEKYKHLYIKPTYGSRGANVYRIEQVENGDIHIFLHRLVPTYICSTVEEFQKQMRSLIGRNKQFIVQQGIRTDKIDHRVFDIRVLVQKNYCGVWDVSSIASRVTYDDFFNTSVAQDVYDLQGLMQVYPIDEMILQSLNHVSVNIAHIIEARMGSLGELSVDFVVDEERRLWVIELNGNPQKNMYAKLADTKAVEIAYCRPIEYAYFLSKNSRRMRKRNRYYQKGR